MEIPIRADIKDLQGDLSKAVSVVSDASDKFTKASLLAATKAIGGTNQQSRAILKLREDYITLQTAAKDAAAKFGQGSAEAIKAAKLAEQANNKLNDKLETGINRQSNLNTQFRSAQKEALKLANLYGVMDERTLAATKRAGELKDSIEDTKVVINAFKADSKFTVVAGALQQAAGAASIFTGAMGLMGVKSEETQKMMLKVQSALALTQGLAQLKEMGASFTALSAVIKASVIPTLMTMNGLLIASGIGALVAVVAALGYAWYKTSEAQKEAARTLEEVHNVTLKYSKRAQDLNVQLLKGRVKAEAEITNETTKEILSRYETIAEIQKKAKDEERALSKAELLEISQLKQEAVKINQIGELKLQDLKDKYREEDLKKAEAKAEKLAKIEKKKEDERLKARAHFFAIQEKYTKSAEDLTLKNAKSVDQELESINNMLKESGFAPKPLQIEAKVLIDQAALLAAKDKIKEFAENAGQQLVDILGSLGLQAANALGRALAGNGDWGESLKQNLASLMSTIAAALMALGTAIVTVNPKWGAGLIIGAVALAIAAGALSASAGSGGGSGGTMVQSPNYNANIGMGGDGIGGQTWDNFKMRTEGKDLILAIQRSGQYNRRG